MNIVMKNRGKRTREKFFEKNTRIGYRKNVGKKSSEKSAKNVFLYSHEYRDQKMGGKKREEKIVIKHTNRVSKNCWKKIVWKNCENTFFINT